MTYQNERSHSTNRSVGDQITSDRLQDLNKDLDELFKRLDDRNLAFTYLDGKLISVVDSGNSITINLDRTDFSSPALPKIYIQVLGDTKKYTITYSAAGGPLQSIVYA